MDIVYYGMRMYLVVLIFTPNTKHPLGQTQTLISFAQGFRTSNLLLYPLFFL